MRRALLIGINNYPGNELDGCVEDISRVKEVIERNGDGSPNFEVLMMPDVQTASEVMDNIRRLFSGEGDASLLYFSGHGYVNDTGAEIVMPQDTISPGKYYMGIQMRTIMDVVNASKVKNKIVVLDCCHSGNIGKYDLQDSSSHLQSGVSILTACREDEYAEELGGHGIFTELLCSALNGGAADYCGNITIGGIYSYIDRSLGAWQQRPVFKTNVTEFVPIRKVAPQVPLPVIRALTNLFRDPNRVLPLDPSFEDTNDPSIEHKYREPYAIKKNVEMFKILQKLQSIGFVKPVNAPFMYYAAMESKGCELTELGRYYWRLVKDGRI